MTPLTQEQHLGLAAAGIVIAAFAYLFDIGMDLAGLPGPSSIWSALL